MGSQLVIFNALQLDISSNRQGEVQIKNKYV